MAGTLPPCTHIPAHPRVCTTAHSSDADGDDPSSDSDADSDELSSIPQGPCAWPVGSTCEVLVLCLEPPCLSALLI